MSVFVVVEVESNRFVKVFLTYSGALWNGLKSVL